MAPTGSPASRRATWVATHRMADESRPPERATTQGERNSASSTTSSNWRLALYLEVSGGSDKGSTPVTLPVTNSQAEPR